MKGVSKTIIEVNNTGSKLFEKIVFYVTPEYGNLSAKQLKRAASTFAFNFEGGPNLKGNLRKKYKRRRALFLIACSGGLTAVLAAVLILIF